MGNSRASQSRAEMGQMSSQPQVPSGEASASDLQGKSMDKKGKPKKSRKKSVEVERPIDQVEEESARTLLQISKAPMQQSSTPYYEDGRALPMHPSTEPIRKSKSRKMNNKKGSKQQARDKYDFESSEEQSNGMDPYPEIPSTPPEQIDRSSPSPYRPTIPPANALDEIPTDDDDVAAYEKYARDTASTDRPGLPDHDMFSYPQQPSNPFDQDETGEGMHKARALPANVYALPQTGEKEKKKKRKRRTDDQADKKSFAQDQSDDIPIDPELHSMNALPPSTDLNNLNGDDQKFLRENVRNQGRHDSSQPRKRRRLEKLQGTNGSSLPYMSPYSLQHDQENVQDHVLPGYEDMQTQASSGLDSSFQDNAASSDPGSSADGVEVKKSPRRKENRGTRRTQSKKERGNNQEGHEDERAIKDKAEYGGSFSAFEGLQLDAFRDNHCEANDMTIGEFNNLIQTPMRGNAQVTALFNEIHDILPHRPRMSVQKFCRRRFHNFKRGTWSPDEDELLKQAVEEKGKAWKEVGDSLGRMPEDCRDRWRNYLVNSEHRNREQWTDAEVVNLCSAILECMKLMKEDRMRAREAGEDVPECGTESDQEVEDMKHINWQAVSDRMGEHGGGRSRLQCNLKWNQLKKREQVDFLKAVMESRGIETKTPVRAKNPWRMKLASKKVGNMKSGDIYALLQAVVDLDVPEEGNIPWRSLGDVEFRATWTSADKKAAWSRLKEQIPGSESKDYRSLANEMLSRIIDDGADSINERWDPNLHGDVSAKKPRKKRRPRMRRDRGEGNDEIDPANGYLQKSNEYVYDSDALNGTAGDHIRLDGFEHQGYNAYDVLPMSDGMDVPVHASNGVGSMAVDDQEDVFNDGTNANGHLSMADGEVSPELAGRLHSALTAHNMQSDVEK